MVTKNQLKYIRQLGQKKYRDLNGQYLVEGKKIVNLAFKLGLDIKYCLFAEGSEGSIPFQKDFPEVNISSISGREMASLTQFKTPSDVIAVVGMKEPIDLVTLLRHRPAKIVYLDSVRDPGNVGTIIRLADWFGWDAVVLSRDTVEYYNPKVVQASMGSVFRYNPIITLPDELLEHKNELFTIVADMNGENIPSPMVVADKIMCLVVGNESRGVRGEFKDKADLIASIHGSPGKIAESLNVAMATAIFLDRLSGITRS